LSSSEPDIRFPHNCSFRGISEFSKRLIEFPSKDRLVIDTGPERFFSPTAMLMLAKACRARGRKNPEETLVYRGLGRHSYANNLGFSEALNIKDKPYPRGAFGGYTYIPISGMSRAELSEYSADNFVELGEAIEHRCSDIARIVSREGEGPLHYFVTRAFREIFRNCFEHAEVDNVAFCAQYWPSKGRVEICIVDRGIGMLESLNESKHHRPLSDREALYFSLMPGVSSKAWRAKKKKASQRSEWDNSGYGLFFSHQLFGAMGHFFVASGSNGLLVNRGGVSDYECAVEGTVVSASLNLSQKHEFEGVMNAVRDKAAKVKERLGVKSIDFASIQAFLKNDERFDW